MSTFDWLVENEYPLLLLLFVNGMVPYGYGDITQTPVVCVLSNLYYILAINIWTVAAYVSHT
jgi:hypothetical protein